MKSLLAVVLSAFVLPHSSFAEVQLPFIFTDHMVLQRDLPVPVWGKAAPGEEVTVEFAGQKKSVKADAGGTWMVQLNPLTGNFPNTFAFTSEVEAYRVR